MADNTFNFDLDAPAVPTLTLDPAPAEEEKAAPAQQEAAAPEQPQVNLTPEEQAMVDQFAEKIDITNSQQVLQYGSACQKKIGDFSEAALSKVATKDLGEVGDMITSLIGELKSFDAGEEEKKGILGFFKKKGDQLDAMKMKYNKAETNVEKIQSMLEGHQVQLLKDIAMLDKMYELNMAYFKELSMYILAGKKKLADVRANELQQAMDKAKASGLPEDAQAARDLADQCERFEKKLYDLELTRNVSIQMGPQIRLIQSNDTMMAEKIQTLCRETNQPVPETVGQIARCIYESLALKYRWALERLEEIKGQRIDTLNIVGGGCQNKLLNQFVADSIDRPVITGPIEGAAIGNLLAQAMALGDIQTMDELRAVVRRSEAVNTYEPHHTPEWEAAYQKLLSFSK